MGPFRAIGNTMLHTHWAHPFISAILSMGPFIIYTYFTQWVHVGFSDLFNKIACGLSRSLRQMACHGLVAMNNFERDQAEGSGESESIGHLSCYCRTMKKSSLGLQVTQQA